MLFGYISLAAVSYNEPSIGEFTVADRMVKCKVDYLIEGDSIHFNWIQVHNTSEWSIGFPDFMLFQVNYIFDGLMFGIGLLKNDPIYADIIPDALISLKVVKPGASYKYLIDRTVSLEDFIPLHFTFDYVTIDSKTKISLYDPHKYFSKMHTIHFGMTEYLR